MRKGEAAKENLTETSKDKENGELVLRANNDRKGPGPLVTQMSRSSGSLPVPMTVVPGDLTKEQLEAIT